MTRPNDTEKSRQNPNHMGGPSFFPEVKTTAVKRPIPPPTDQPKKMGTRILKDEDIPPL